MREILAEMKSLSKERYMWVIFFAIGVFLLPEYLAPIGVLVGAILANKEAKAQSRRVHLFGETGRRTGFFIAGMLLTVTYSASPLFSLATVLMWLLMAFVYLSLLAVITDKERLCRLFQVLTLCLGVLGIISCIEYFGCHYLHWGRRALQFWNFLDEPILKFLPVQEMHLMTSSTRAAATFTNPNIFAEAMIFLIPISAYSISVARHVCSRVLFSFCLVVGVLGTGFSFSRSSYFCLLGILFLFLMYLVPRVKWPWNLVIFVGSIILVYLLVKTPNVFAQRMQTLSQGSGDKSISERTRLWTAALAAITKRPIFGYGAGIQSATDIMTAAGLPKVPHAHSTYLELLIEGGAVLLTLFFLPIFNIVYTQWKTLFRKNRQPLLGYSVMVSLAGLIAFGLVDFPLLTPKLVGIWWILFALSDLSAAFYADQPLGRLIEKKESTPDA